MNARNGALKADEDTPVDKDLLRLVTCGSMRTGKSSLIDKLISECGKISGDEFTFVEGNSHHYGSAGDALHLAVLLDGSVTDVSYRHFATPARQFIIADALGDERYMRNMAAAASLADIAIVVADVRHGLTTQTRRHSQLISLMETRRVILAVNKMDLVDNDETVFLEIKNAYMELANQLGMTAGLDVIPVSALSGANVAARCGEMGWYRGETLLGCLHAAPIVTAGDAESFCMPVEMAERTGSGQGAIHGQIVSGRIRRGQKVIVLPSGKHTRISALSTGLDNLDQAEAGRSVALSCEPPLDTSQGEVITVEGSPLDTADQFDVSLIWMHDEDMLPGRHYSLKCATRTVSASITKLKHKFDPDTFAPLSADKLEFNEIGRCNISTDAPIVFGEYSQSKMMGSFILVDSFSDATVGMGMINFALRRATNITSQAMSIDRQARSLLKSHRPAVVWLTGISGAGKSTIANLLEEELVKNGAHTMMLDGDNLRHGLNRDLGFTDADRVENLRRITEVAGLGFDAGLIVIVAAISPFKNERQQARDRIEHEGFIEVFVDTPLQVAEARDTKGLYAKARAGAIANFTGIDSPYEAPEDAEIVLETSKLNPGESAMLIVQRLKDSGIL